MEQVYGNKRLLILVFFSFVLFLFLTCSRSENKEKRTVFLYNESAGITSLDPAFAKDQANIWVCNQLYNGLVQLDNQLETQACIAHSWNVSEDGKTYTFFLRNDVYFHTTDFFNFPQGKRKVIASDFVYSFNRIVDKTVASPGAWIFNAVDTCKDGTYAFLAVDDTTLVIRLKESFPPFLKLLTMQYCSVVPKEVVDKFGKDFRKYPVGTGPFKFKMWKEGLKLVMLKNDDYFEFENNQRLPYLDAVAVSFIIDKQAAFMEFVKGNLDFLSGLDASYKDELLTKDGRLNPAYNSRIYMLTMPYLNTEYLGFLMDEKQKGADNNPLLKKEIRQALNYGFDRRKMLRFLRSNIGEPGLYGMIPYGLPPFDTNNTYGYDFNPEKARALMAAAGYPNGKGLPPITISVSESYIDIIQYIAYELEQIGFKIKIAKLQAGTQRQMIAKSELPFFRGSWIADYPDAENYLSLFYSKNFCPSGPNYTHYKNAQFDKYYEQSQQTSNDSLRMELYKKMDALIMEDAPVIVLYYDQVLRFVSKKIVNMDNNAMNLLILKKVKKINN